MEYNFTIRKKDKGFQIILSYKNKLGKWKQKSKQGFKTQREAKEAKEDLLKAIKLDLTTTDDPQLKDITFKEFSNQFMLKKKPMLAHNSYIAYSRALKKFETLNNIPIKIITPLQVDNEFSKIHHLSYETLNLYKRVLIQLFEYAISPCNIIQVNPCKHIKLNKKKTSIQENIKTISDDECDLIFNDLSPSSELFYILSIARYTGTRLSEILGLTFDDLNLDNNTITINKQLLFFKGAYSLEKPKSINSTRTIPIPPVLVNILKKIPNSSYPLNLLFNPLKKQIYHKKVNNLIAKYSPNRSIHCFRHTYATKLLSEQVDIKTVAALLGDTTQVVMDTYIHYTDELREKAAESVASIFK